MRFKRPRTSIAASRPVSQVKSSFSDLKTWKRGGHAVVTPFCRPVNLCPQLCVQFSRKEKPHATDAQMPATGEYPLRLVDFDTLEPQQRETEGLKPLIEELLAELRARKKRAARIVVRTSGKTVFLRTDEVDWVEASGNYVRLHAKGEAFVLRESMKNMEAKLDNDLFVRIHRSAIVNVDRIRELQPWFHGEYVVILQDGTRLMASRVFSDRLDRLIA